METKPRKGDKVVITKLDHHDPSVLQVGMVGKVIKGKREYIDAPYIDFGVEGAMLHNACGLLKSNTAWALRLDQFELVRS